MARVSLRTLGTPRECPLLVSRPWGCKCECQIAKLKMGEWLSG